MVLFQEEAGELPSSKCLPTYQDGQLFKLHLFPFAHFPAEQTNLEPISNESATQAVDSLTTSGRKFKGC